METSERKHAPFWMSRKAFFSIDDVRIALTETSEIFPSRLDTPCWRWKGPVTAEVYGSAPSWRGERYAHRLAYLAFVGKIPNGLDVCHKCDTPLCVNPNHLFLGTAKDNVQDSLKKGRFATQDVPFEFPKDFKRRV